MAQSTPERYHEGRTGEGNLWFIIKIGRVVMEVEIAKEDEVVALF